MKRVQHTAIAVSLLKLVALATLSACCTTQGSPFIAAAAAVPAPIGQAEFCRRFEDKCRQNLANDAGPERLTSERFQALSAVNTAINNAIASHAESAPSGPRENWRLPLEEPVGQPFGDCEDYALQKQERLSRVGFARSNLRLAITLHPSFGAHAVLIVRSERGDLVLDNLNNAIRPWNETAYVFLSVQSTHSDVKWQRVAYSSDGIQ